MLMPQADVRNGPLLSVVIPCYNERPNILDIVSAVRRHAPEATEIIIVDDASNDGTREILKSEIDGRLARVIYHERNRGKGAPRCARALPAPEAA